MKSKNIKAFALISIIILIVVIVFKISSSKNKKVNELENKTGFKPVSVQVIIIQSKTLENKSYTTGTILSNDEVELRCEASGKVTKILFKEGSKVKKGDLLVKINDADLKAQLHKAELKLKLAEDKEQRQRLLLKKDGVSVEAYEFFLNELNSIKADIENINALIDKTEIKAPFDGTIGLKYISEGSYISPQTRIASLQNNNPVKIEFSIPQNFSNQMQVGNTIKFQVSSAGKNYIAKIYAIEPKIDPATRTLQVRAIYSNEKQELIPGAFVEIELILDEIKNAISIPTEALIPDLKGEKVFIAKNGLAISKPVKIGMRTEKEIQITNGLNIGDTLIVSGIIQLKPNAPIKISNSISN